MVEKLLTAEQQVLYCSVAAPCGSLRQQRWAPSQRRNLNYPRTLFFFFNSDCTGSLLQLFLKGVQVSCLAAYGILGWPDQELKPCVPCIRRAWFLTNGPSGKSPTKQTFMFLPEATHHEGWLWISRAKSKPINIFLLSGLSIIYTSVKKENTVNTSLHSRMSMNSGVSTAFLVIYQQLFNIQSLSQWF